jgi:broad specificity phosphatase PhoE
VDILLIRHCESIGNSEKKLQGWFDSPLTEKGRGQAEDLAGKLAGCGIEHLYSSPLSRARATAEVLAVRIGCTLEILELLREIDVGDAEGLTIDEVENMYPHHVRDLLQKSRGDASLPGGETRAHFHHRAGELWEFLSSRVRYRVFGCVSHGWMINALLKKAQGLPLASRNLVFPNGAVQHLRSEGDRWEIVTLDCIAHETRGMRVWQLF